MPLSIRGPHGYMVEFDVESDSGKKEWDTYRCQHCGGQERIESRDQHMTWCKGCMQPVCPKCAPKGSCNKQNPNFEQWLLDEEAKGAATEKEIERAIDRELSRRSYG